MSVTLVHVGYQKCASTTLQRTLFDDEAAGFCSPLPRQYPLQELVLVSPFRFDAGAVRADFQAACEQRDPEGRLVRVVSHENLIGDVHSGGRYGATVAERIAACFPEGKVLLVFREQVSMIRSAYMQYLRDGGTIPPRRYLQTPESFRVGSPRFERDFLEYDLALAYYRRLMGAENVLALPVELLRTDPGRFYGAIGRLVGRDVTPPPRQRSENVADEPLMIPALRLVNKLFFYTALNKGSVWRRPRLAAVLHRRAIGPLGRRAPKAMRSRASSGLWGKIRRSVGGYYAESNRRLSDATGIDLAALGYDVAARTTPGAEAA